MNHKLYDALEICLQALKNGASLDSALARFPDLAPELRPLLKTSQRVHGKTIPVPSAQRMRSGRAQLLQQAAEMREARRPARRQSVIPFFQRLAIAASLSAVFLLSGTGLVQASSSSLPGENLYPVKRTWEDMRLLFVFTPEAREAMESQYDQERLNEVSELLRDGRVVSITFTGLVTADQNGNLLVSGVLVEITPQTVFSGDALVTGVAVTVTGQTEVNGHVIAASLQVLPPGVLVPTGEPAEEGSSEPNSNSSPSIGPDNGNSFVSNDNEADGKPQNDAPGTGSGSFHIEGVVQFVQGNMWIIDGQTVYMDNVTLPTNITVGSNVEVKGYFAADGRFIVTRIDFKNSDPDSGNQDGNNNDGEVNNNGNGNDNVNSNDNSNENSNTNDNGNSNENSNTNDNDNSNENDNSNSGNDANSNENTNNH